MRGLLMKDLELIKINMKMYLAVFLIGIIYLVAQENGSTFFVAYAIFVSISVSVGTISYDGYHHGMKFLMTLPVTKKAIYTVKVSAQLWFCSTGQCYQPALGDDKNTDFRKTGSRGPFDKRRHCTRYFLYNTLRNDSASLEIRSREKQDCYGGGGSSNLSGGCCM